MRYAPLTALALAAAPSLASISQSTVVPPGGFVQAGVYTITGGTTTAGTDMGASNNAQDFEEHAFTGISSAHAVAAYSVNPTTNSADATGGFGYFRARAENVTMNNLPFPSAQCNGGWKETFTVNNAALIGQAGFMTFQVRARGTETANSAGSASLRLAAYKNNFILTANPYFSAGNSDVIGTSNQYGQWGTAVISGPNTRVIDGTVTFSVPITFGQSFTLGVYALAAAGLRSSGGAGVLSTALSDFSGDGVRWYGGIVIRNSAGTVVTGSTVISGSGIDWTNPYIPPPTCGSADFDGDGDSGTDADIEAFFACLGGNCCATCFSGGADFNGDGDSGTDADIESFFRVLGGGPC